MEAVLLWLDDLDDVIYSMALVWERLRHLILEIGLAASLALVGSELSATGTQWWLAFSGIAAASVAVWLLGATLRAIHHHATQPLTAA